MKKPPVLFPSPRPEDSNQRHGHTRYFHSIGRRRKRNPGSMESASKAPLAGSETEHSSTASAHTGKTTLPEREGRKETCNHAHPSPPQDSGGHEGGGDGQAPCCSREDSHAEVVTPGDATPLNPEDEVLVVVGTQGLKVREGGRVGGREGRKEGKWREGSTTYVGIRRGRRPSFSPPSFPPPGASDP
ncbi:hypothetical protein Naga_101537g2, partial [Nannochloropsis gaditana]